MKTILIVDDHPQNLDSLLAILEAHGYGVTTAANGAEALEKARSGRPDLIISDILMPIMDGFALCREWKRDDRLKDIPFVFLNAAYTDPKDEEFAPGLGAERFITKPQAPEILRSMIEEVFSGRKAGSAAVPADPRLDKMGCFREYDEALIRRLEDKMVRMCWIGQPDPERIIRPVACKGFTEGYPENIDLRWNDASGGKGPTEIAVRTGQPCVVRSIRESPVFTPERTSRPYKPTADRSNRWS